MKLDGDLAACDAQAGDLELQYRHTLENPGKQGTIFRKAGMESLIRMIDKEQWSTFPACATGGFLLAA